MKAMKRGRILLPLILLAALVLAAVPAAAETAADAPQDEWTVMFYFCGSDLESKYGYATENLMEIGDVNYPTNAAISRLYAEIGREPPVQGKVNVLVETGGSREWHGGELLQMDFDPGVLQRWCYHHYPNGGLVEEGLFSGYELMESLPLQSMGAPETLADFIRWGVQTCPAKKYALVLWDHGGGAQTGLMADELFGGDTLYLYELKQAMADCGARLDTVVIDACLMANLETAWTLSGSADWLVASEEEVPGKGTAIREWLQALLNHPDMDGQWLGRCVCDMTATKYSNSTDQMAKSLMTWSVTDLSKIGRLTEATGKLFRAATETIAYNPEVFLNFVQQMYKMEEYGNGQQNMRDLGSLLYSENLVSLMDYHVIDEAMRAFSEAVTYVLHGPGRSNARGLSFCYPLNTSDEVLDLYARNFPCADYLAFLDSLSYSWKAPDDVYEQTPRLPEATTLDIFKPVIGRVMQDGMPALQISGTMDTLENIYYRLYRKDQTMNEILRLGRTSCMYQITENGTVARAGDPMHWPAIDGNFCCMDLVEDQWEDRLYNIPVRINSDTAVFRCGRFLRNYGDETYYEYEIYGVWEGYDENSPLMNRSVQPLAMLTGREFSLLYPKDEPDVAGRTDYETGPALTIYRKLDIGEITLPPGTYYLEYEVENLFRQPTVLERIEFRWDGEQLIFPEGFDWSGIVTVKKADP